VTGAAIPAEGGFSWYQARGAGRGSAIGSSRRAAQNRLDTIRPDLAERRSWSAGLPFEANAEKW
jgi:hypothetical protein